MQPWKLLTLITTSLALAACGGGGGGGSIASAPPPVPAPVQVATTTPGRTPLPPTPATTTGTYQTIATYTSFDATSIVAPDQLAPAGSVRLAVDASTGTYTLTATAGPYQFAAGQLTMPANSALGFTQNNPTFGTPAEMFARGDMLASTVGAGTGENGALKVVTSWMRLFNVGHVDGQPRYLSAAHWGQFYQENASGVPGPENYKVTQGTRGLMVFGQRTESADMPVTGTARYSLQALPSQPLGADEYGNVLEEDSTILDVDFATRGLRATYDMTRQFNSYQSDDDGNSVFDANGEPIVDVHGVTAVHATGSTTIASNGSFSVLLSGTGSVQAERRDLTPVPNISTPVSGSIDGAFFGPRAAEVGAIGFIPVISQDGTVSTYPRALGGIRN